MGSRRLCPHGEPDEEMGLCIPESCWDDIPSCEDCPFNHSRKTSKEKVPSVEECKKQLKEATEKIMSLPK